MAGAFSTFKAYLKMDKNICFHFPTPLLYRNIIILFCRNLDKWKYLSFSIISIPFNDSFGVKEGVFKRNGVKEQQTLKTLNKAILE